MMTPSKKAAPTAVVIAVIAAVILNEARWPRDRTVIMIVGQGATILVGYLLWWAWRWRRR